MKTGLLASLLATTTMLGASQAQAESLVDKYRDGANVTLAGTVSNVEEDEFMLNYGDASVEVEFDNWKEDDISDLRAYLRDGASVVVNGEVDKDLFSESELDADNIYFRNSYDYYYVVDTNPAYYATQANYEDGTHLSVRGKIEKITGDEMTINTGNMMVQVDTADLGYDVTGEDSSLQLVAGDRIYVHGTVDDSFYDEKELSAQTLIKLNKMMMREQQK